MRTSWLVVAAAAGLLAAPVALAQDSGARPTNLNASITLEQKQRIRAVVFQDGNAPRVARVDFALTIGNAVPRSVPTASVPDELGAAFPEWRGYAYFVLADKIQDQIIIVSPRDHTIIAIIP